MLLAQINVELKINNVATKRSYGFSIESFEMIKNVALYNLCFGRLTWGNFASCKTNKSSQTNAKNRKPGKKKQKLPRSMKKI